MLCEKCNNEMIYFRVGVTCGWKCPSCENAILTTFTEEIDLDEVKYTLTLLPSEVSDATKIKLISKITSLSFVQSKELLANGGELTTDYARRIKELASSLNATSLSYSISPEFPYEV